VSFTGGFHPLPRLQIALPLPLGVEGLAEWLDLELIEPMDPAFVLERLQQELPNGLWLHGCEEVLLAGPSLSQELEGALWRFALHAGAAGGSPVDWPEPEDWDLALRTLLQQETWIWHDHDKKGRHRQRDCRQALREARLLHHDAEAKGVELVLDTRINAQGFGVRPGHLQSWLGTHLGQPLRLGFQRREALVLKPKSTC
jgi:radical SAM-linked protein